MKWLHQFVREQVWFGRREISNIWKELDSKKLNLRSNILLYIELHFILVKGNPKPDIFKHFKLDRNILHHTCNEAYCRVLDSNEAYTATWLLLSWFHITLINNCLGDFYLAQTKILYFLWGSEVTCCFY